MSTEYRIPTALLVRLLGGLLVLVGLVLLALALAVGVLSLPPVVLSVAVVVAVVVVVVSGFLLTRVAAILHLDEVGYRVRLVRGAGVKQARWLDVEDVVTARASGQPCVVLRLKDGRTTTVPMILLGTSPEDLFADLERHLDRGHGYRRLS